MGLHVYKVIGYKHNLGWSEHSSTELLNVYYCRSTTSPTLRIWRICRRWGKNSWTVYTTSWTRAWSTETPSTTTPTSGWMTGTVVYCSGMWKKGCKHKNENIFCPVGYFRNQGVKQLFFFLVTKLTRYSVNSFMFLNRLTNLYTSVCVF